MDLKNEISITDIVNAVIALLSLFIALTADKRSRSAQKREHLERKARAYHDIVEILKKGNELTVADPESVLLGKLANSASALQSIVTLAREAIDSVSAAFPNLVLDLEKIIENGEELIKPHDDLRQNKEIYAKVISELRSLYSALFSLSAEASARGELGDLFYDPSDRPNDPFFKLYRERAQAFLKESKRLTDQDWEELKRMFNELRAELVSEFRRESSGVRPVLQK